jgi:hypothetical protein
MSLVKPKNSLLTTIHEGGLLKSIQDEIKSLPNFEQLKHNSELFEYVLQKIENGTKSGIVIDKVKVALQILNSLYGYQPQELKLVENQLVYMVENKIIQKIPILSKFIDYVKSKSKNFLGL